MSSPPKQKRPRDPVQEESNAPDAKRKRACATTLASVPLSPVSASTATSVASATQKATSNPTVPVPVDLTPEDVARPRFLRGLVWSDHDAFPNSFGYLSLTHPPLPDVPVSVREDPVVNVTLRARPDLFKIVTPVNVDVFAGLLVDHPNQPFVQSVLKGLREGFWPFADAKPTEYPDTWDDTRDPPADEAARSFLRSQRDEELRLGRYSESFGPDLLPGMYCMPVHVVPKPHSDKLRLVNDQSAGSFSLNSMIRPEAIKGAVLDGMPALGADLRALHRDFPGVPLILWKSDVSQAYCRLPVSFYWQNRQAVTIDGLRYIDRCNLFGSRGSLRVWMAFYCLVHWIAQNKRGIRYPKSYVDDNFGPELRTSVEWYAPYGKFLPRSQARLLRLWDDINLPHEEHKQVAGVQLTIVGFFVDAEQFSISLPPEGKQRFLQEMSDFIDVSSAGSGRRRSLAQFRAFTEYANWAFNAMPLHKPALAHVYAKTSGKSNRHAGIYPNAPLLEDLRWLLKRVQAAAPISLLRALAWSPGDLVPGSLPDEFALVDASGTGLGLYFPWLHWGFHCLRPAAAPVGAIFFFEALAVCSAVHRVHDWCRANRHVARLAVLSDNTNTVSIFNTLQALPPYNPILMSTVNILLDSELQLRVDHIPGKLNVVADALSRGQLDVARAHDPLLKLFHFTPPQDALGACGN
ncbi:hypothetical protein C8T65DRAFT_588561 [Cerioporus squamosus]|nr:hypothetical protein C8T65DRAFT_588561 [Cerioporus squamosus]